MASSIRVLHARPVLTRKQIEGAMTAFPCSSRPTSPPTSSA
jgi:hypothetical protein